MLPEREQRTCRVDIVINILFFDSDWRTVIVTSFFYFTFTACDILFTVKQHTNNFF